MSFQIEIPANHSVQLRFEDKLTSKEFEMFCAKHPELIVEREPDGQINVMSPVHLLPGGQEASILGDLIIYTREKETGKAYSATTGFTLPDGSVRSADASYISNQRLATLSTEEKHSFARVVPQFVVELRSDTDRIGKLQTKTRDVWIANGVQLAWLIDPKNRITYVYRADGSEQVIAGFDQTLSGEDTLPDFEFDLSVLDS